MKYLIILLLLAATTSFAHIGDTVAQTETQFGKSVNDAKPIAPATAAYLYRQGELGVFVGYIDGKAVYELIEAVEDDGDFGEVALADKDLDACLKAERPDGGWTEIKDAKDGKRHWKSSDGKLIATTDVKHFQLLIESAEFAGKK